MNWNEQMPQLVNTYLAWKHSTSTPSQATDTVENNPTPMPAHAANCPNRGGSIDADTRYFDITAVWTHGKWIQWAIFSSLIRGWLSERHKVSIAQIEGEYANVSLVRRGLLGCSPIDPAFAISLHTLEFYHRLRRRHPRLGIQAMARSLCDVHEVRPRLLFLLIFL